MTSLDFLLSNFIFFLVGFYFLVGFFCGFVEQDTPSSIFSQILLDQLSAWAWGGDQATTNSQNGFSATISFPISFFIFFLIADFRNFIKIFFSSFCFKFEGKENLVGAASARKFCYLFWRIAKEILENENWKMSSEKSEFLDTRSAKKKSIKSLSFISRKFCRFFDSSELARRRGGAAHVWRMPNNIPAKIALDSQPYSDGRRKRRSKTRWIDGVLEDLKALAQWKVFIQKGGQNFFLLIFLIFGVKTMFSMILWDSTQFFGKIRPGQFLGQNLGFNILLTSRNEVYISKMVCDGDL